jgi:DNA-binding transcriptional ArsR family regulator
MPELQQQVARRFLEQLDLPPNDRSVLKSKDGEESLSNDDIAWRDFSGYPLFIDVLYRRVLRKGQPVAGLTDEQLRLFVKVAASETGSLPVAEAFKVYFNEEPGDKPEKKLKAPVAELQKAFKDVAGLKIEMDKVALTVTLPKTTTLLLPSYAAHTQLSAAHKKVLRQLRRYGTLPLASLQEELKLNRAATRRELNALVKLKLVEAVRDGRGQAFRLI